MIRVIDAVIGMFVVALCALLAMTVWGHRHGMSLAEACDPTDCGKLTLRDWCDILFIYIVWSCTLFIVLRACLGYDNRLLEVMDQESN